MSAPVVPPTPGEVSTRSGDECAPPPRRYRAFISYSHSDTKWARWLMRRLEGYSVPQRFHGRTAPIGEVGKRIAPVFRDRDELPTTSDLGETIRHALRESSTLVVICSPASARSRWVEEEIRMFKRLHGEGRVFAFIVAGEPKTEGAADDCFSKALRWEVDAAGGFSGNPAEHVGADARAQGDGPKLAFIRLVAGLLGVGFDELRQRELQRRNRRLTLIAAGSAAGMALTLGLAVIAWQARNEALLARNDAQRRQDQAEDVLAFMLGDFRAELKKLGQLQLLNKVGEKAMTYFDSLDARDLTDSALARQARALTQIGEVQLDQKDVRYAEATRSFLAGYHRAAALAARYPKNGDILFERAQAEFWIGDVLFKRGDPAGAATWLTRYRDTAVALVALNPAHPAWQRELVSGHHNLAVLEVDRGNLAAARAGFLAQYEPIRRLIAANPTSTELQFKITDLDSYLGALAARMGDLPEARRRFAAQRAGLEALHQAEPETAQWMFKLADCLAWEAETLAVSGDAGAARAGIARGIDLLQSLLQRDPANRRWAGVMGLMQLRAVAMTPPTELGEAADKLASTRADLEKLAAAEPKDRSTALRLLTAWRLEAQVRFATGRGDAADAASRGLALGEGLVNEGRVNDRVLAGVARCSLTAGEIAGAAGQAEAATTYLRRAIELLAPRLANSNDWALLDPAARTLAHLGRFAESQALIERLRRIGYVPLEPWPSEASVPMPTSERRLRSESAPPR